MKKILIVEDEKVIASAVKDFLSHRGYPSDSVHTLKDGLNIFSNDYGVVLLDIQLGQDTSFPLLKKIKEESPNTIVLMFSGYDSEEYIREAKNLGADGFIPKPFRLEFLDEFLLPKLEFLQKKNNA